MAETKELVDYAFKLTDVAIIAATLTGPILAVQAQKWLEKVRAINDRRNQIFRVLMATRGAMLSPGHVEALNAIPVEFYGNRGKLKEINEKWKEFLDHHAPDIPVNEAWMQKRLDLFTDLLHLISQTLGYGFSRSQLARDIYNPKAHGELENEQTIIRTIRWRNGPSDGGEGVSSHCGRRYPCQSGCTAKTPARMARGTAGSEG